MPAAHGPLPKSCTSFLPPALLRPVSDEGPKPTCVHPLWPKMGSVERINRLHSSNVSRDKFDEDVETSELCIGFGLNSM